MSKRNWVAAVAFGLSLSAFSAIAQEAAKPAFEGQPIPTIRQVQSSGAGEQNAREEPSYADRFLAAVERIEPAIRKLIAEEDEIERQAERSRDSADLRAQQEMARWAFWIALVSGASVFLTAIGLALIGGTLMYTKQAAIHAGEAVGEARNATKAAQDAIEVTRQIGLNQMRPWVVFQQVDFVPVNKDDKYTKLIDSLGLDTYVVWVNKGGTPAVRTQIYNNFLALPKTEGGYPAFPNLEIPDVLGEITLSHGVEYRGIKLELPAPHLQAFVRGETVIFLTSRVVYTEPLNPTEKRISEVALRLEYGGEIERKGRAGYHPHIIQTYDGPYQRIT